MVKLPVLIRALEEKKILDYYILNIFLKLVLYFFYIISLIVFILYLLNHIFPVTEYIFEVVNFSN